MQRAALYVRVSSQGQVRDGYSLAFQEQILREFCQRESLAVAGVYRDGGQSGSTTRRRDLARLIADAREHRFEWVLIFRVDRFSRDPLDLLALVRELAHRRIKLRSVTEAVDAGDPAGELMLTILGAIGKFVRQNIIQNAMLGKTKRAETGRFTGGRVPFGYVVGEGGTYEPDGRPWWNGYSAAEVVQRLFSLYIEVAAQGGGCGAVARRLNALGVPGPHTVWGHSSVYQILTNPCYVGDFAYNRRSHPLGRPARKQDRQAWVLVPDAHPPLVQRETWERVQRLLRANRRWGAGRGSAAGDGAASTAGDGGTGVARDGGTGDTGDSKAARPLLTGFLRCGECGAALTPRRPTRRQPHLYYTCLSRYSERRRREGRTCRGFPWLRADDLERVTAQTLLMAATAPRYLAAVQERLAGAEADPDQAAAAAMPRLERRLAALDDQEMTLTTAYAEGRMPEHLWQRQMQRLAAEREALGRRLRAAREQQVALRRPPAASGVQEIKAHLAGLLGEPDRVDPQLWREALGILVGPRGIRVFRDGRVEFGLRLSVPPPAASPAPVPATATPPSAASPAPVPATATPPSAASPAPVPATPAPRTHPHRQDRHTDQE